MSNYSLSDPFLHIHRLSESILNAVHPAPLSLNSLVGNYDYTYSTQLQIIQGVCFGLSLAFLLGALSFAVVRMFFDGCGGREPDKFGYSKITLWTNKIAFYTFGGLTLIAIVFGLISTSRMYTGIGTASDIYYTTLPPLTSTQKQYIERVVEKNTPLFNMIKTNLTVELQSIWDAAANSSTTEILQKANFTEQTQQIHQSMLKVQAMVPEMRMHRVTANRSIDELWTEIKVKAEGTSVQNDVNNILDQFLTYYNFTPIDTLMQTLKRDLSALAGRDLPLEEAAFVTEALSQQLETPNYITGAKTALKSVNAEMMSLFDSLNEGTERCEEALESGHSVPFGGASMTKFAKLIKLLNPIKNAVIPVLFVMSGVLVLSLFVGGAAFPMRWHQTMYTLAFLFVLGIAAAWATNGFIIPATVITTDTCNNQTFFRADSGSSLNLVSSYIPTCASCDQQYVFADWKQFKENAEKLFDEKFQVTQALSQPFTVAPSNQQVSGASVVLATLKNLQTTFQNAQVPRPNNREPWQSNLQHLEKNARAAEEPIKSIVEMLQVTGRALTYNTVIFYNNFVLLKQNLTEMVKPIDTINESMKKQMDQIRKSFQGAFKEMQNRLNEFDSIYYVVPADRETQCLNPSKSLIAPEDTYSRFQNALCGDANVGMSSTWFINFVISILLIPLTIAAVKAYKHLAFANFFQDDYQAF